MLQTASGLRYPEDTDHPVDEDDNPWITLLAEDIDDALTALIPDSGDRTDAPVTASAGFQLLIAEYRLIGKDMTLHVWVARTDTAITANASGNIAGDPPLFTIDEPALRPAFGPVVGWWRGSFTGGIYSIETTGVCSIYDAHSSSSIPKQTDDQSSTVQVYANYPIP